MSLCSLWFNQEKGAPSFAVFAKAGSSCCIQNRTRGRKPFSPSRYRIECLYFRPCKNRKDGALHVLGVEIKIKGSATRPQGVNGCETCSEVSWSLFHKCSAGRVRFQSCRQTPPKHGLLRELNRNSQPNVKERRFSAALNPFMMWGFSPRRSLFAKTLVTPTLSALGEREESLDLPHTLVEQRLLPWSA